MLSAVTDASPLTIAEFGARLDRLARFEASPLVAVAVSGGPDSLALALLAERWAKSRGGQVWALTVDHGLRPESGAEARTVAGWLAARGIRHAILRWDGDKPTSRIQERARVARYRLLAEWCRAFGCLHLLTGHHRDDQRETRLLRQAAGSGPDGRAGMSAIRETDGCRILRPLLDVAKVRLIATVAAAGQPFVEDPSNRNTVFARARLRAGAAGRDRSGADAALACRRIRSEAERDHLLARAVALHPAGFGLLDPAPILAAPAEIARRALAALVHALSGNPYPPRQRSVERLREDIGRMRRGSVLGGFRFVGWRGRILVLRERSRAAPPLPIEPGAAAVWDRRFAVAHAGGGGSVSLGYLDRNGVTELRRRAPDLAPTAIPALAYPILPAFRDETGLAAVPAIGYARDPEIVLPRLCLRPANALSHASFVVV